MQRIQMLAMMILAALLAVACSKPVTQTEVTKAINSVKEPSNLDTPSWPENAELETLKHELDKAYSRLSAKVVGRENILSLKHMFPRIDVTLLRGSSIKALNSKLLKDTGWKIVLDTTIPSALNTSLPKTLSYEYCSLAELIYDLSEIFNIGVYADFSNKTVHFTNQVTKTFYLPVIPGKDTISMKNTPSSLSDIGGGVSGTSGGSSSGNSEESGDFEFQNDSRDILSEIGNIVGRFQGVHQVILNRAISEITVTATVNAMLSVEREIQRTINEFSKQVDLYITVVEVRWTSDRDRNRFFSYLKNESDRQYKISIGNDATATSATASFAFSKTNPIETIQNVLNLTNTLGKTKVIANTRVLAQNGAPTTLFSGNVIEYVKSSTITFQQDRQVVTPVVGTVSDGLTLHVMPKILDDDHILLNIIPRLASVTFQKYTAGNSILELPRSRVHQQYARFVAEDGTVNVFGGLRSVSKTASTTEVDKVGINVSGSTTGERKDILFVVYGKIVDLSGRYVYMK